MPVVVDADVLVVVSSFLVEVSVVISDEVVRGEVVVIVVEWPVVGVVVVAVAGDMEVVGMAGHITSAPAMESSLN